MFPWDTAKNSDIRFRDTAVWFSADIPLWVGVNYSPWCTCVRTWVPDGGTVLGCKRILRGGASLEEAGLWG